MDLIGRAEERLAEMEEELAEAKSELAPQRQELLDQREVIESEIESLGSERTACAEKVQPQERVLYERIQSGGRAVAVAPMTQDGACGHCFAMVPLQIQNEIRAGRRMVCCESCGVILAAPLPEPDPEEVAAAEAAAAEAPQPPKRRRVTPMATPNPTTVRLRRPQPRMSPRGEPGRTGSYR